MVVEILNIQNTPSRKENLLNKITKVGYSDLPNTISFVFSSKITSSSPISHLYFGMSILRNTYTRKRECFSFTSLFFTHKSPVTRTVLWKCLKSLPLSMPSYPLSLPKWCFYKTNLFVSVNQLNTNLIIVQTAKCDLKVVL